MTGRVGLPAGVQTLEQLRTSGAARNAGTHWQVKLNDSSRGKVVIGDVTLLFQFVTPPPVQPRPQLPAAARGGFAKSIDWMFTAFVLFSFMSHFGLVVYLENADWPIEQGIGVDSRAVHRSDHAAKSRRPKTPEERRAGRQRSPVEDEACAHQGAGQAEPTRAKTQSPAERLAAPTARPTGSSQAESDRAHGRRSRGGRRGAAARCAERRGRRRAGRRARWRRRHRQRRRRARAGGRRRRRHQRGGGTLRTRGGGGTGAASAASARSVPSAAGGKAVGEGGGPRREGASAATYQAG